MPAPKAALSLLHRADGSATYTADGYSLVGAVNGPVEVQRRDELPDEAALEVNIRPASGVGTTRERHVESILHATLRHILLLHEFPRSLVQLTLQVLSVPQRLDELHTSSYLPLLPSLLTTAVLTLLSANIPLSTTLTTTLVSISKLQGAEGKYHVHVSTKPEAIASATSLHVFGFTGKGEMLLSESEGDFDMNSWIDAFEIAKDVCISGGGDTSAKRHERDGDVKKDEWLRNVIADNVDREQSWRNSGQS